MADERKPDLLIPAFFAFGLVAILPPVVLFTLFKPFGAAVISSGWLALMAFALVMFVRSRDRLRVGIPAADVAGMRLGFKLLNDRVLAGEIDGVALEAIWSPSGTRIDATLPARGAPPGRDAWLASVTSEQRLAMFDAITGGEMEVAEGKLQMKTPLSFRVPEHGDDLVYRLRDAARVANALCCAGAPPDGCVAVLRAELARVATPGTLALATPRVGQGALSVSSEEGRLSAVKKGPQEA